MANINKNYLDLAESYLFVAVAKKQREFEQANPNKKVIKMSIGDVTRPLPEAVTDAMKDACAEMGTSGGFHGYGPEQGYDFLRSKIAEYYKKFSVSLSQDEVFVSDGAKSDIGNVLDIFSKDNTVLIPDPVYPVYLDTNIMDGRKVIFLSANESNGFLPLPDEDTEADLIYICSPNNPTGAVYSREQLAKWIEFARKKDAVIFFDAAYESFVTGDYPHSIYELDGAKECAIEFCSLSKTAGFTGVRCGYTIVPHELKRNNTELNKLWLRRQSTKFNGVSYVTQKGAEAVFSPAGQKQVRESIDYYRENAKMITDTLDKLGWWYIGGKNSPYIWLRCPNNMGSWEFLDDLLEKAAVVGTPGEGFGEMGKGYFRLTSFSTHENTREAMDRIFKAYK